MSCFIFWYFITFTYDWSEPWLKHVNRWLNLVGPESSTLPVLITTVVFLSFLFERCFWPSVASLPFGTPTVLCKCKLIMLTLSSCIGWKNQAEARLQGSVALEYKDIHRWWWKKQRRCSSVIWRSMCSTFCWGFLQQ